MYRGMGVIFFEVLGPILQDESIDHVERLRLAIKAHVLTAIENQGVFEIYFRERHEIPKAVQERLVTRRDRIYIEGLTQLIESGVKAGAFQVDDPRVAAFAVTGACNWITFWYRAPRGVAGEVRLGAEEIAANIFQTVGAGLISRRA